MSAETKLELLGLIDQAVAEGWAHPRACRVLDLADSRAHHWRARLRETGSLKDGDPGGGAVHGILAWEEQAILDLIETWGPVDRSHRKLAHRGSYLHRSGARVALHGAAGGDQEPRQAARRAVPSTTRKVRISRDYLGKEPDLDWDATNFTRCKRVTYAIVDVVTRYWIGSLLTSEQTHTQVQLLFARVLQDQDLLDADGLPPAAEDGLPILVAWSDNGDEMTAIDTRQFMALMAITQHHLKRDWPHLLEISDPAALDTELARVRCECNTTRLHAAIGYVTPDDEHHGRGPGIRRARAAGLKRSRSERIKHNRANKS